MTERKVMAILSADGTNFTLRVGSWRGTFPIEKLDDWIETYRGLAERHHPRFGGKPYRPHYQKTIEALEKLKARIEQRKGES